MLAHKDSKVCPTATQISPVRLLDPDDGKFKYIQVQTRILGERF